MKVFGAQLCSLLRCSEVRSGYATDLGADYISEVTERTDAHQRQGISFAVRGVVTRLPTFQFPAMCRDVALTAASIAANRNLRIASP